MGTDIVVSPDATLDEVLGKLEHHLDANTFAYLRTLAAVQSEHTRVLSKLEKFVDECSELASQIAANPLMAKLLSGEEFEISDLIGMMMGGS